MQYAIVTTESLTDQGWSTWTGVAPSHWMLLFESAEEPELPEQARQANKREERRIARGLGITVEELKRRNTKELKDMGLL